MNPEHWEKELREAGWKPRAAFIWEAPNGALTRGPFGAWIQMQHAKLFQSEPFSTVTIKRVISRNRAAELEAALSQQPKEGE